GGGADKFYGFSILHRLQTSNERWALSPRYDWYKDRNGLITGTAQTLQSFTLTGGFRMAEGFLTRLEYRRDWSGQPFFDRGNELANAKQQSTIVVGLVVYFNGKRL
ncbi:MAG TPA: outer membrane beta-barrel protein, partial [Bryobacteraceae bacterium]|nr:outer membrane beta-barrel protein [Bryobacteraceae bacterium]